MRRSRAASACTTTYGHALVPKDRSCAQISGPRSQTRERTEGGLVQAPDEMINRLLTRRQQRSSGTDPSLAITPATYTSSAASNSTGIHHLHMPAVVDNLQGAHQAWWTPELMPRVVRLHSSAQMISLSARTQQADAYNKELVPEIMTK